MRQHIKISHFDAKTIQWWKNRRNQIDMDPPYQRHGRLWSDSDKAYLIDSIINGFDVPKLYMADFTWGDSLLNYNKLPYAIIDGKQRLEAIFDFYDGKIVLNDDFIYRKNPQIKLGGLGYKDLQKNYFDIAEEFDTYNLSIMSVISDNEELINELFVRLNRSKPLTGAEIRNAMSGYSIEFIRNLAKHDFFTINIRFNTNRMTDQDTAAKLLMMEYYGKLLETKRKNLDDFVEKTKNEKMQLELAARRVYDNLENLAMIFLPKDKLLSSAGIIPDYYWFIRDTALYLHSHLREFLKNIEVQRIEVLRLVDSHALTEEIDKELIQLNSFYRSPNDASSHEGRVKFFKNRFIREHNLKK